MLCTRVVREKIEISEILLNTTISRFVIITAKRIILNRLEACQSFFSFSISFAFSQGVRSLQLVLRQSVVESQQ